MVFRLHPRGLQWDTHMKCKRQSKTYKCYGLEELLRQADILQSNSVSFGKLLAESATNLKIIALVSFSLPFAFHMSIPL